MFCSNCCAFRHPFFPARTNLVEPGCGPNIKPSALHHHPTAYIHRPPTLLQPDGLLIHPPCLPQPSVRLRITTLLPATTTACPPTPQHTEQRVPCHDHTPAHRHPHAFCHGQTTSMPCTTPAPVSHADAMPTETLPLRLLRCPPRLPLTPCLLSVPLSHLPPQKLPARLEATHPTSFDFRPAVLHRPVPVSLLRPAPRLATLCPNRDPCAQHVTGWLLQQAGPHHVGAAQSRRKAGGQAQRQGDATGRVGGSSGWRNGAISRGQKGGCSDDMAV